MAAIVDLSLNPPKSKRELTKMNMIKYVSENGSAEDKAWFKQLCNDNKLNKKNNLKKGAEIIEGYNMPKIREEFAKRFFPEISSANKKQTKAKKKTKSFSEMLEEL